MYWTQIDVSFSHDFIVFQLCCQKYKHVFSVARYMSYINIPFYPPCNVIRCKPGRYKRKRCTEWGEKLVESGSRWDLKLKFLLLFWLHHCNSFAVTTQADLRRSASSLPNLLWTENPKLGPLHSIHLAYCVCNVKTTQKTASRQWSVVLLCSVYTPQPQVRPKYAQGTRRWSVMGRNKCYQFVPNTTSES